MPQRDTSGIGERIPREIIEADFEVAFSMVEMAQSDSSREDRELATTLLHKAEGMLDDIRARLQRMTVAQREPFEKRCEELSHAIEAAGWPGFRISGESQT